MHGRFLALVIQLQVAQGGVDTQGGGPVPRGPVHDGGADVGHSDGAHLLRKVGVRRVGGVRGGGGRIRGCASRCDHYFASDASEPSTHTGAVDQNENGHQSTTVATVSHLVPAIQKKHPQLGQAHRHLQALGRGCCSGSGIPEPVQPRG